MDHPDHPSPEDERPPAQLLQQQMENSPSADPHQVDAQNEHYADQLKQSNVHSVVSYKSTPQDLLKIFKEFTASSNFINMAQLHASPKLKLKKYKEAVYYGDITDGKRHGQGILLYENGRIYEGNWECDFKHGQGYQKFPNGCLYQGDYVNGRPEGVGRYSWPNGQFYEGEWIGGLKQGSGMWRGAKGDSYIGEWKGGKADGYGVHTWVNGDRYQGEFKECLKSGEGIQKFANGDLYRGTYQKGKPCGFGEYYWANGSYFKGQFKQGLRDGQGLWKRNTGSSDKYEGSYKADKKDGYGIFTWASGNVYKGQYENDQRNGLGEMYWRDGSFYKGNWQGGVQHGKGEVYVPGEGYKKGYFENNVLIIVDSQSRVAPIQNPTQSHQYPSGLDPEADLHRHASKKTSNYSIPSKVSFRSRGTTNKRQDVRTRSIDQNTVVRFGAMQNLKNNPLLPKRFSQSREQKYVTLERKSVRPVAQKRTTHQRVLHSSFYMHKMHNQRANTSINGSRAEVQSGFTGMKDQSEEAAAMKRRKMLKQRLSDF